MRGKEDAHDYRYFPEPDIPPLYISPKRMEELRALLPEFAHEREVRLCREYGISHYDAGILCISRTFADLFEETVRAGVEAKECANWLLGPIRKQLHDAGVDEDSIRLSSNALAAILACVAAKRINRASAIALLEEFLLHGGIADTDVDRLIEERGYAQIGDSHAIMSTVQSVIAQNPAAIEDYLAGKKRAEGFLIGQTMKAMGGRADPTAVKEAVGAALKQIMLT